jgi:FAD/FMN-containing dehydrogenase
VSLLKQLEGIVGKVNVLTDGDVSARVISWFDSNPMEALAIVRPANTAEVSAVVTCCAAANVSLVPMGGLTGFVEGAVTTGKQVGLSLERMAEIESIDEENACVVVQAGVPLQKLHEFAEAHQLHYPVDLGARGSCTLGGMAATNAGGNEVLRYGMTREQILGLEVVLADGRVISNLRPLLKNNTGYDLKQMFIGSEGTLGIITRLTLRLRPLHSSLSTALVAVNDFKSVTALLRSLEQKLGGRLSAFEVMWQEHYKYILHDGSKHTAPMAPDYPFYILIQAANYHSLEEDIFMAAMEQGLGDGVITDAVIALSIAQQKSLWAIRDDIERLTTGLAPYLGYDVSLPIKYMDNYIRELDQSVKQKWPDAKVIVFGHLGDGNLHLFINIGPEMSLESKADINRMVYSPLEKLDGSISAEHGIGFQKKQYLPFSRSADEIELMRDFKRVLDPHSLLNPGSIFDT